MRFSDSFLDELRTTVPIEVAADRRGVKLRKVGAERVGPCPVCGGTDRFAVNTKERVWNCRGCAAGGDIFAFLMRNGAATFEDAVVEAAAIGGIPLPNGGGRRQQAPARAKPAAPTQRTPARAKWGDPVELYPFLDRDGAERYHTARFEWTEDGKSRKAVVPRRLVPGVEGLVWGIKADDYIRNPRNGEWYQANDDRRRYWPQAEVRHFDEEAPILYRLPELLEELGEAPEDQRIVFIPEGERKADLLASWGCVATTCAGGTNGWLPHFPDYFAGADVVIMPDNDDVGRKFAHAKAASLREVARRIRILDLRLFWPGCPQKGDVVDWAKIGEGSAAKLFEIVEQLQDWTPEIPKSEFNALRFSDLDRPRRQLEWLVKAVLQRGEMSVWFGDWGTGKSFLLTDCAFSIARGTNWFGRKTRGGLVIYQAGEGEIGFGNRMDAYRKKNHIDYSIPFVGLCSRINLFSGDKVVDTLIAEGNAWSTFYRLPLELLVIDTFSAASSGADENSGRDVGAILDRARRISRETGTHVAIVHHIPKSGNTPRGWGGFLGNVDSAVLVENLDEREVDPVDGKSRVIHKFTVIKQKDAASHFSRTFTLPQVILGKDSEGDDMTSCVVRPTISQKEIEERAVVPKDWCQLHRDNEDLFRALKRALNEHGILTPPGVPAPRGTVCCRISDWQDELVEERVGHVEITPALRKNLNQRIARATKRWMPDGINLIGKHKEWVWRSDRKVYKVDPLPRVTEQVQPEPVFAPGEDQESLVF
jgi:hypothetical protein